MKAVAAVLVLLLAAAPGLAQQLRIATFNTELSRDGPGLLLRDIDRGEDPQIAAVIDVISANNADVLLLQGIDWDLENRAVQALRRRLSEAGTDYPHLLSLQPNAGRPPAQPLDLDGDGKRGEPRDNQGYGRFRGQGGMALLSKLPIDVTAVRDLSDLLWRELPQAQLPHHPDGTPYPSRDAQQVQRLSDTGHWVVPLMLPDGTRLHVLGFHATPPVFDGPEDRNGRRNHDEIRLWQLLLNGELGPVPPAPFVIVGDANLDPDRGAGRRSAIRDLLSDPRLQDPVPESAEAGTATVDWASVGKMRVSYVLPSAGLRITGSGVDWPHDAQDAAHRASRHRLVWTDITLP